MKYRLPLTCLGVTPGMRVIVQNLMINRNYCLVVPRHSLENDLVVSLNLKKKEDNFNILEHIDFNWTWKRKKREFYDFKTKYC